VIHCLAVSARPMELCRVPDLAISNPPSGATTQLVVFARRRRDGVGVSSISISRANHDQDEKTQAAALSSCLRAGRGAFAQRHSRAQRHVNYRFKDCPAFPISASTSLAAQPVNATRLAASLTNLIGNSRR